MSKWILRDDSPAAEKNIPMLRLEERLDTPDQSAANPQNFTEQEVEFNRLQAHSPLPGATGSSLMLWWQQTRGPKGPEPALGHWILHIACTLTALFQVHDTQRCGTRLRAVEDHHQPALSSLTGPWARQAT